MPLRLKSVNVLFFSTVIADLQYSADAEKVSLLLKAPLYFDLEMYSNSSQLKKVGVTQKICFMVTQCCISTLYFLGITLSAPGPAAGSNMWDCGKAHGAPCASGLCPVGLHPLL